MIDIDFPTLHRIGFKQHFVSQLAAASPQHKLARVTSVQRDWLTLDDGREAFPARNARFDSRGQPVVGDWVLATHSLGDWWIDHTLDPFTRLSRRAPLGSAPGSRMRARMSWSCPSMTSRRWRTNASSATAAMRAGRAARCGMRWMRSPAELSQAVA